MEDLKKRKLEEASNGQISSSPEELKLLLDPLSKSQLVDLLSKLYVFNFNFSIFICFCWCNFSPSSSLLFSTAFGCRENGGKEDKINFSGFEF